jgi:hypothetical protein
MEVRRVQVHIDGEAALPVAERVLLIEVKQTRRPVIALVKAGEGYALCVRGRKGVIALHTARKELRVWRNIGTAVSWIQSKLPDCCVVELHLRDCTRAM